MKMNIKEYIKNITAIFCEKYYPKCSVHIMVDGTISVIRKTKNTCAIVAKILVTNGEIYKFKGYDEFDYETYINFLKEVNY